MARHTILVIDDDKHLVELIQQFLEAHGYLIYTAFDGLSGELLAQKQPSALIIMDVDMPMASGLQTLQKLQADPKTQGIPVIMLTGVLSDQVYPVVESMANVSHLKKPVHLEDLLSMVHHYIPNNL